MDNSWGNKEPGPLEYFHKTLMELFHQWRVTVTERVVVEFNGIQLNNIIAKAKKLTYEKYKVLQLEENLNKCPVCGNIIVPRALVAVIPGERHLQFCSEGCAGDYLIRYPAIKQVLKDLDEKRK